MRWRWDRCKPLVFLMTVCALALWGWLVVSWVAPAGNPVPEYWNHPPEKVLSQSHMSVAKSDSIGKPIEEEQNAVQETVEASNDVLVMEATAYTHADPNGCINGTGDGITATGYPVRKGVVAVDPAIIPLGTELYIEGYGNATALDTGGAIRGQRIDVFFESPSRAMEWGRRKVEVEIID